MIKELSLAETKSQLAECLYRAQSAGSYEFRVCCPSSCLNYWEAPFASTSLQPCMALT